MLDRRGPSRPTAVLLLEDLHWDRWSESETVVEALMSLATSRSLLVLLTRRIEYTPDWLEGLDVLRIWLGRSTRSRQTRCSTICSVRLPISMRSRPVSSATPARSLLFIEDGRPAACRPPRAGGAEASWDTLEIPPTVQGVIASRRSLVEKIRRFCSSLRFSDRAYRQTCLLPRVTEMPIAQPKSALVAGDLIPRRRGRSHRLSMSLPTI